MTTNSAPVFKAPFGGAGCQVSDPREHKGYHYVVAWCIGLGATSRDYVIGQCNQAAKEDAPVNAIYKTRAAPHEEDKGTWVVFDEIARPENKERIEQYVQAMVDYERRLAEWRQAQKNHPPLHSYTLTFPATVTVTVRAVSLKAAAVALAPVDGQQHHEVKQVVPAFGGTMRLLLDRTAADLVATDDPEHKAPPAPERRMPLGT
ncbi:hypothetical protein [Streptomyces sp. MMBL 11-1]|uniref:hypothetical protein n=1 Tax=Streptomyces sp. MMBL 11-1 TaxID=3026420 RepID=UPI00235E650C|nr:hypothetical protein [Streptomyces sp. MMBL 11-1]